MLVLASTGQGFFPSNVPARRHSGVREGLLYDEAIWEKGGWFQDTGKAVTSV